MQEMQDFRLRIQKLVNQGRCNEMDGRLLLTNQGKLFADHVAADLFI